MMKKYFFKFLMLTLFTNLFAFNRRQIHAIRSVIAKQAQSSKCHERVTRWFYNTILESEQIDVGIKAFHVFNLATTHFLDSFLFSYLLQNKNQTYNVKSTLGIIKFNDGTENVYLPVAFETGTQDKCVYHRAATTQPKNSVVKNKLSKFDAQKFQHLKSIMKKRNKKSALPNSPIFPDGSYITHEFSDKTGRYILTKSDLVSTLIKLHK